VEVEVADGFVKNIEAGYRHQEARYHCIAYQEDTCYFPDPITHRYLRVSAKVNKINCLPKYVAVI